MAVISTSLEELKQEISAAIANLSPQIRGLDDLAKVSLSSLVRDEVNAERLVHARRNDRLRDVLTALDGLDKAIAALLADGYPVPIKAEVTADVFQELQDQLKDLIAALSQFEPRLQASKVSISLGAPAAKP